MPRTDSLRSSEPEFGERDRAMSAQYVYLILGSRGGGRAAVVSDLIDFGIEPSTSVEVCYSTGDRESWDSPLDLKHPACLQMTYEWEGTERGLEIDPQGDAIFVVADGHSDPADFVESFFLWLKDVGKELGRILTVADCGRIHEEPKMLLWYDCCVHFSDVVLLSNRRDVPNKWIDEFKDRYLKEYYPCLFEFVKKGRLANPSLVLEPEARRISKLFDEAEEYVFEDDDEDEELEDEDEFAAGNPEKDPYLAKLVNGRREKTLPVIRTLIA